MRKIEDIIADKLIDMTHYVLAKLIKPDITFDKVTDLDGEAIEKLKQQYGIEAIILDIDDTIRKDKLRSIPKHNKEWIESLKGKIKVIILSNGIDKDIEDYMKSHGIDYIGFACKPLKRNFKKACSKMQVDPDKVLVVGNSLFDDIYGGRRNNMKTALIKRVEDDEGAR